jgi:hypothetical protein
MGDWIYGIVRALRWLGIALIGRPVPRYVVVTADRDYFRPSAETVENAITELARLKIDNGFTQGNYKPESWDCDNAALHDYNALLNHILPDLCSHVPEAQNRGFACGMFSYMTRSGARHRVAYVEDDTKKRTFIDTFEKGGVITREVSREERAAGFDIV